MEKKMKKEPVSDKRSIRQGSKFCRQHRTFMERNGEHDSTRLLQ